MKNKQLTAADRGAIEVLLKNNYTLTEKPKKLDFTKVLLVKKSNKDPLQEVTLHR